MPRDLVAAVRTLARALPLCGVLALVCGHASVAHAHGPAPTPLSLIAADADGARAVRLSRGIALRMGAHMRFACPALWGAEDTGLVVANALPHGPIAIATGTGLYLLADDGTVARHPDPIAAGRVIALAATDTALYVLQARNDKSELIEVQAEDARVVWSDAQAWSNLAAGPSTLLLVRLGTADLQQLTLEPDGEVTSDESALAPDNTIALFAHLAGSEPYVVAAAEGGTELQLGRIEHGNFSVLQTARGNLAGPLALSDGHRFIALEGALSAFDDDQLTPLGGSDFVTCLGTAQGQSYACTTTAIRALDADGLGDSLFDLSQLLAPDSAEVPDAQRTTCDAQWQHYRFDLLAAGVTPAKEPDAGAGGSDAGSPHDAGQPDAELFPTPSVPPKHDSDCSTTNAVTTDSAPPVGWLVLAALLARRRARR